MNQDSKTLNTFRGLLGQGLMLETGDEVEAWLRSRLPGQGTYADIHKKIKKEYENYSKENPILSTAVEFAGGALPALGALAASPVTLGATAPIAVGALSRLAAKPLLRNMARNTGIGTVTGGISGAGSADSDSGSDSGNEFNNRLEAGLSGSALGAGLGFVATPLIQGGSSGLKWLKDRFFTSEQSVKNKAAQAIKEAMDNSKITPKEAYDKIHLENLDWNPAITGNIPSRLAHASDELTRLAQENTKNLRGVNAGENISSPLIGEPARKRVMDNIEKYTGSPYPYKEQENKIVERMRRESGKAYEDAYSYGTVDNSSINELLKEKTMQDAFAQSREIASRLKSAAIARGETGEEFNLVPLRPNSPLLPDVRTLDYIQRTLKTMVDNGMSRGSINKAEANSYLKQRDALLNLIDEATIDPKTNISLYAAARKRFSDDAHVRDAIRYGRNSFNKLEPEEISSLMSGKPIYFPDKPDMKFTSNAEKEAFISGSVGNMFNKILSTRDINVAKYLSNSPLEMNRLRALIPDAKNNPDKFNLFKSSLIRQGELYDSEIRRVAASYVGKDAQARASLDPNSEIAKILADMVGNSNRNALTNIAARALRSSKMDNEVAKKINKMLLSHDPGELETAVTIIQKYAQDVPKKAKNLSRIEAGAVGGITQQYAGYE